MMSFLVALVMGGIIGWLASKVMKTDKEQGPLLDVLVGCAGSLLGKFLFGLFRADGSAGLGLRDGIDLPSLAVAFGGALALLGVTNLIRKGRVR
jgi:uncharacterized membrane protein YeaQ/YmgE (transglycosylase-associated protein family)